MDLKALKNLTQYYTVLYVEDDTSIAGVFINYLEKLFENVQYAKNGQEGLDFYKEKHYDLVITDIQMPVMDGLVMTEKIKEINKEQNVLVISAYSNIEKLLTSIRMGVDGYILKPIEFDNLNDVLFKTMKKLKTFEEHKEYETKLEKLVEIKTNENYSLQLEQISNYEQTLFALVDIIENRDTYTGKHSLRVAQYSKYIAEDLGYTQEQCDEIYKAGILHDLGKVAIPDSLLLKPSHLNEDEYGLIKLHVNIGYHMLNQIPMFKNIAEIIYGHHERSDGSGYPNGLKKEDILEESIIMAVADSFDAMTTNRIYKHRKSKEEALLEIEALQDTFFTPKVVQSAIQTLKNVEIDKSAHQNPITSLEKERFSYFYRDNLTGLYNENYLDYILNKSFQEEEAQILSIVFLNHFGTYNKKFGWTQGNQLLVDVANKLSETTSDLMKFRIHGDDFVIIQQEDGYSPINTNALEKLLHNTGVKITIKEFNIRKKQIDSVQTLESIL